MNGIEQRILNETNLLIDDQPHFFKGLLDNPEEYLTWDDVENCLNNPYLYQFEMIDPKTNSKIDIPESRKAWIWDRSIQDKRFMFEHVNKGYGLVIMNYGFYSRKTMELLQTFENMFDVNAAIHVYSGLEGEGTFGIHDDYPANFIIQTEGTTKWKIFKNRLSYMHRTGVMNGLLADDDLEVAIDVTLEPGDALYIPSRMYHKAYPEGKRLSMSIPCWAKFPTDPADNSVDRNFYRIER